MAVVFDGDGLLVEFDDFPFVARVVAAGPAFVVSFDGEKSQESVLSGVLSLIE